MNVTEEQKALALETASAIEQHQDKYNQSRIIHKDCGTPACVAGWICHIAGQLQTQRYDPVSRKRRRDGLRGSIGAWFDQVGGMLGKGVNRDQEIYIVEGFPLETAEELLGLSRRQGRLMFHAHGCTRDGREFTPTAADAATMLRHFAETGEVLWTQEEAGRTE